MSNKIQFVRQYRVRRKITYHEEHSRVQDYSKVEASPVAYTCKKNEKSARRFGASLLVQLTRERDVTNCRIPTVIETSARLLNSAPNKPSFVLKTSAHIGSQQLPPRRRSPRLFVLVYKYRRASLNA